MKVTSEPITEKEEFPFIGFYTLSKGDGLFLLQDMEQINLSIKE